MLKSLSSPSDLLLFQRCEETHLDRSLHKRLHSPKYRSALHKMRKCAQIGRCAKQLKVLPHTAVCEIVCLTD